MKTIVLVLLVSISLPLAAQHSKAIDCIADGRFIVFAGCSELRIPTSQIHATMAIACHNVCDVNARVTTLNEIELVKFVASTSCLIPGSCTEQI